MNRTKIEWVRNPDGSQGYTWNPITGCLNRTPEGLCLGGLFPCYAFKLANGRLSTLYLKNSSWEEHYREQLNDPFYPRFWPERLYDFGGWRESPKGIFVCDMGELFGDWIPKEWQEQIFSRIKLCPQHRFYLLTKQPQNLIKFSPFPDNCQVGVTATDARMFKQAIEGLSDIKAKVKYVSLEPMLERIYHELYICQDMVDKLVTYVDWLIIGAQTKPYKPPKIEWIEEIVRAADRAGIKVFLKDNLKPFLDRVPTRIVYQYGSGKLRQEVPG